VVSEIFFASLMSPEGFAEVFCPWNFPEVCVVLSLSLFFADFAS
jgi:hypothetical protein